MNANVCVCVCVSGRGSSCCYCQCDVLASVSVSISFNCNTFVCCLMANLRASYKSTFAASDLFLARKHRKRERETEESRKNAANCFLFLLR